MKNQAGIRLVSWNIEKGKRWDLLERCLETEAIRSADILCLNEVDDGMARSGNRRIANQIAACLGMQAVFGPAFRELTKGAGDELLAPGENTAALQGNATLSRLPILDSKNFRLPMCHNPSKGKEKREGGRSVLLTRIECGTGHILTVANTHLEVLTTMRCRSRQMRFILSQLRGGPAIIAGDLNTNTFERGSRFRTICSVAMMFGKNVKNRVLSPWDREPLFRDLESAGFNWRDCVDNTPTCSVDLSSLEDKKYIPAFVRERLLTRVRILPLKLDFIAARGLRAVTAGKTITELPCQPSDHRPITCDLVFE
ncbi:MAG: endonuclease/exonuclease/phosphatase family protein [Acidobacteria bacterium]|nr:endonuclease/exonuclease/phosphatase family protein [Acidobacteriota bacterium]